ncbi:MerR family transcriptional regulator [Streptomyces albireticuli]|uniref:Transcriptional regulator n=1 Tax=Streptomyces albireticuli TaxID=1940 RepID=A0A2A2DE51_9ACTN|nr:MerR family transcriptional regulator [Streptomyces albireticuli]MCD9140906.1 MerR family transcriptional regulator [Streptomyces albireticuli]MCD9161132.1 MerR family transcriptional regulator [Streptomyces albireticuli]MCD9190810.1 MerR family transcriptional regulator [Streptomyces albireticuli]PAU49727.1 transcriptional regulator [Streptomyces albireticuli]
MATETEGPTLTVDELAARAGVTVRTVRFYSTRGLLPPPEIGPRRVGRYGADHLSRLALIEELQHQGLTLAAIERYLRHLPDGLSPGDLAIHRALVASWMPDRPEPATRAQLERRAGRALGEEDLDRLTAMAVLERDPEDADAFLVDPGLLYLGLRLLDVPIAPDTILAARAVLLEHARSTARSLTRLFHEEVDTPDVASMKSLSAHMQPLVVQALVTAFQRSLKRELRELYAQGDARGSAREDAQGDAQAQEDAQGDTAP